VGKGSADHACKDTENEGIKTRSLALAVEGIEETAKIPSL
jgi:hypothetical protein